MKHFFGWFLVVVFLGGLSEASFGAENKLLVSGAALGSAASFTFKNDSEIDSFLDANTGSVFIVSGHIDSTPYKNGEPADGPRGQALCLRRAQRAAHTIEVSTGNTADVRIGECVKNSTHRGAEIVATTELRAPVVSGTVFAPLSELRNGRPDLSGFITISTNGIGAEVDFGSNTDFFGVRIEGNSDSVSLTGIKGWDIGNRWAFLAGVRGESGTELGIDRQGVGFLVGGRKTFKSGNFFEFGVTGTRFTEDVSSVSLSLNGSDLSATLNTERRKYNEFVPSITLGVTF